MMKRLLLNLWSFLMLAAPFALQAEEINFGYCGPIKEPYFLKGNPVGQLYGGAIELPQATAQSYKGCSITSILVGFGTAEKCEVEIFIATDLSAAPLYTQKATVNQRSFTPVPLNTPFEITGEKLFLGYKFESTSVDDAPMAFDRDQSILSEYGHWVSTPFYPENFRKSWEQYYPNFGNVCIRAIIEGSLEGGISATPESMTIPPLVRPDTQFNAQLTVLNSSPSPINNIEILWSAGQNSGSQSFEFDTPIKTGSKEVANFKMKTTDTGKDIPVVVSISKVNGQPNDYSDTQITSKVLCSWDYALRNVLAEKNTGTACGNCPLGIVAFEMIEKEAEEGAFLPVEVHNYNYTADRMYCESYYPWNSRYTGGSAPCATFNRIGDEYYSPMYEVVNERYNTIHNSITDVDISLATTRTGNNAEVTASVRFSEDHSDIDYGVGFILTEDNLGPYNQSNYFANGSKGPMYGWEDKPGYVSMVFNDVAREIFDWEGAEGSIPQNVTTGNTYKWTKTLSLDKCTNPDNVKVTAFVADRKTYEILNAIRAKLGTSVSISDTEISDAAPRAICHNGILTVEGDYTEAFVYTPDGRLVTTLCPGRQRAVPSGILLIKIADGSTLKIINR